MTNEQPTKKAVARQISEIMDEAESELIETVAATPRAPEAHPPRAALDQDMRQIKESVLRMGSLVEDAIRAALDALIRHDADAATAVIVNDRRINEMQREISTAITRAIATQAPVARDLRFLLSLDHVSYELERMGDHAGSVAKQVRKLAPEPPLKRYIDLPAMGELAAQLVGGILRALVDIDQQVAREVAARDDEIDELYHRTFAEVVDLMRADPANVERGTRILFAAHYLERIGDRVTNIAEDVVFLATGEIEDLNP
ncbi:MAG TPA: phosphate signaling complex protein PhoU [Candidatus Limnocylindrales bacterium]|jgi:phosphate transport system protein|nr:phosphate signaling complex protein PhoU [Candidatus Limnocylindrales bacterium]